MGISEPGRASTKERGDVSNLMIRLELRALLYASTYRARVLAHSKNTVLVPNQPVMKSTRTVPILEYFGTCPRIPVSRLPENRDQRNNMVKKICAYDI